MTFGDVRADVETGPRPLGAKGLQGSFRNLSFSLAYSHPRPDFLPWFTLRMGEPFTFSVPGAAAIRNVISVETGHRTKPCWCLN